MVEWKKSSCVLCALNCGLEMQVENNKIVKVRGDKVNPRSQGYCCRKGVNIAYYQDNADRVLYPMKKVGGRHERISWEQALSEITEKMKSIRESYSPKAFAYMGGGALGGQMQVGVGLRLLSALGSRFYYSSLSQEFSNSYWVEGRLAGRQALISTPDVHNADTVLAWGWNGWLSHQEPRTRELIKDLQKDPHKKLIVIDPRWSETAQRADIHLAIRPGTDAMLIKAMITIVIENGWVDLDFLKAHVSGWEEVLPLFDSFDARRAVEGVCGLNYDTVVEVTRLFAKTKSCIHQDLGIYMNRNSSINNYMLHILRVICGRSCVEGGQIYPAYLFPMGSHSDERDPKTWRTVKNNMFPIMGTFPPAIFPEEVLNDHPERLRALIVSASNPLRSYPDTKAYEQAFAALDLSVCLEVAYSETARACDYVLPCLSYLESFDATCFSFSYPEFFFQLRQPVVEPVSPECKEGSAILLEIAKAMGYVPDLPDSLYAAGQGGITAYLGALTDFMKGNPQYARLSPLVMAETLGKSLKSVNLAMVVGLLVNSSKAFKAGAAAMGYPADFTMIEAMFKSIMDHPQGLILARFPGDYFNQLRTEDKKIALKIEELLGTVKNASVETELAALQMPAEYPLILHSGLHVETIINSTMRNPAWNKTGGLNTLLVNAADAARLGIEDGEVVRVATQASSVQLPAEISPRAATGCVYIPHGGGLIYGGKQYGVNVNELVKTTDRDEMCTPMHRRIPCRVEKI
ncbi:MAG: molybdopterin-dependent oxidoreductase [Syntrophomonadaceae bacterium]